MTTSNRYHGVAITLHWLTAIAILALFVVGWTMTSLTPGSALQFTLFQWHKSVGITVLALTLLRVAWALAHRPPPLPETMPLWERWAAHGAHLAIYALLFLMPLSGWVVVSTSPFNIPTVLYGVLPFPHLPVLPTLPGKIGIYEQVRHLHHLGAYAMAGLLAAHVGAALRHHFLLGDAVLGRMLPRFGRRPPAPTPEAGL
jgi:cytochrome b561